jgi:hypothetical protein
MALKFLLPHHSVAVHAPLTISEYGKICAQSPGKAKEVRTGSLPAVPTTGICVIESTAEGRGGDFFDKVQIAQKNLHHVKSSHQKTLDYIFMVGGKNLSTVLTHLKSLLLKRS